MQAVGFFFFDQSDDDGRGSGGEIRRGVLPGGAEGEEELRPDLCVGIAKQGGECLGDIGVFRHEQRFGELHGGAADPCAVVLHRGDDGLLLQCAEPLQRPHRVDASIRVSVSVCHCGERRDDGFVRAGNDELLCGVAPPAAGVREVQDELRGRLVEHVRLRAGLFSLRQESVDATVADDLDHVPLFHPMVASHPVLAAARGGEPRLFLNDAAIHVRKNERPIRCRLAPHRAEIRIRAADELALGKRVVRHPEAVLPIDPAHPQQPPHGFAGHDTSVKFRHEMAAKNGLPAARRELPQDVLLVAVIATAGLIPHFANCVGNAVTIGVLKHFQNGIARRELERMRGIRPAGPGAKKPPIVIAREAPLADASDGVLAFDKLPAGVAKPEIIRADRIVEIPDHSGVLVLDVAGGFTSLVSKFTAVGDAVVVVVEVSQDGVRARVRDQDAVMQREHRARKNHVVDEHRALVHDAVAIRVHELHHAAHRIELLGAKFILHVSAELADIHRAIAVEDKARGFLDHRLTRDALQPVTLRHLDGLDRLCGRERRKGGVRIPAFLRFYSVGANGENKEERNDRENLHGVFREVAWRKE